MRRGARRHKPSPPAIAIQNGGRFPPQALFSRRVRKSQQLIRYMVVKSDAQREEGGPQGVHPVVLFDGVCNFCESSVRFIIDRDPEGTFRFASLQSEGGGRLARRHGAEPDELNTMMLIEDGMLYTRSTAALRIARRLRLPWRLARIFLAIPAPMRDPIYNLIAANRYRWFGRKDECMIPTPDVRQRFLD